MDSTVFLARNVTHHHSESTLSTRWNGELNQCLVVSIAFLDFSKDRVPHPANSKIQDITKIILLNNKENLFITISRAFILNKYHKFP